MAEEFRKCTPEEAGLPSLAACNFIERLRVEGIEAHSFMIIRHGKLCAEGWWKPYAPEIPHPVFSFSKALVATAIGFCVQEKLLNVDDRLVDIFTSPENAQEKLSRVTVRHLLTMSCGHAADPMLATGMRIDENWLEQFLLHPVEYEPGTVFQYNTAGTNILAAVIRAKAGQNFLDYLRPRLLEPLGMTGAYCHTLPDGTQYGGAGCMLTTGDMARFLLFLLNKGAWNDEQLLDSAWIEDMSKKQIETVGGIYNGKGDWGEGYGYKLWRCSRFGAFRADGAVGQFGIVLPDHDAVVAITAATENTQALLECVWDCLVSEMVDTLPENPEAFYRMKIMTESLMVAYLPVRRVPSAEKELIGRSFAPKLEQQGLPGFFGGFSMGALLEKSGLERIEFEFSERLLKLRFSQQDGAQELTIGLCGNFEYSSAGKYTYAAVGGWRSASVFETEIRNLTSASGIRLLFAFEKDELKVIKEPTIFAGMRASETQEFAVKQL